MHWLCDLTFLHATNLQFLALFVYKKPHKIAHRCATFALQKFKIRVYLGTKGYNTGGYSKPLTYLLRGNLQAGQVALTKGVFSNFALGLYHWLSPARMGIIRQLSTETLTALFATMQRAQGPQRQYVAVYHVLDADQEKEAGHRRIWGDPVKPKHWEEHLDRDTHIFFQESKFSDWLAWSDSVRAWVGG